MTLKNYGGYYESPKNAKGDYIGPLVAYAGKYQTEIGEKNYVGFKYYNFARVEPDPLAREYFARLIGEEIKMAAIGYDLVIGAPMGGFLLADALGQYLECRTIFAEKQVIALTDPDKGTKEISELIIKRHEIFPGDRVIIVEDVCNNFSTTSKLKELIEAHQGQLVAIACAINRSNETFWISPPVDVDAKKFPVYEGLFIPTEQYHQEDPTVKTLVEDGKVVWNPKQSWEQIIKLD